MKFRSLKICFLLFISFQTFSAQSAPSVSVVSESRWLNEIPTAFTNDIYYVVDANLIFFPQNYTVDNVGNPPFCASLPWLSSDSTPYCMTYSKQTGYVLAELDPYERTIVNNYTFNNPGSAGTPQLMLEYTSGDYIIYEFMSKQGGDEIFNLALFNTKTKSFGCPGAMTHNFDFQVKAAAVTEDYFIFAIDKPNLSILSALSCSTGELVFSSNKDPYDSIINSYLSSSVFLINELLQGANLKSFQFGENSTFIFGQNLSAHSYAKISDSEFLITNSFDPNITVYKYQITSQLTFELVSSFPVLNAYTDFSVATGLPYLYLTYFDTSIIVYDYNTGEIVQALSPMPPIVLANGSSLNMTQFGYYLTNPGDDQIYFSWVPNLSSFTYFPDRQQYATLYVPNKFNSLSGLCNLLLINQTTSTIVQQSFPSCPGYLFSSFSIKDVALDQNGNINVLYRDNANKMYIVNKNTASSSFTSTLLDAFVSASMNFTSGVCTFAATQATSGFVLGQFWLNNGSIINSTTVASGQYGYTYRLSSRYFLLVAANLSNTNFMVWDSVEGDVFGQMSINFTLGINTVAPFIPLGVDEKLPSVYSGLAILVPNQVFALVNAEGVYALYDDSVFKNEILAYDQNSFWRVSVSGEAIVTDMKLYNVTNWNLNDDL